MNYDADKLMIERLAIRFAKERSAVSRVQAAYGEKYQLLTMYAANGIYPKCSVRKLKPALCVNVSGKNSKGN